MAPRPPSGLILSTYINFLYVKHGTAAGASEVDRARLSQGLQPRAETDVKPATETAPPGDGWGWEVCPTWSVKKGEGPGGIWGGFSEEEAFALRPGRKSAFHQESGWKKPFSADM